MAGDVTHAPAGTPAEPDAPGAIGLRSGRGPTQLVPVAISVFDVGMQDAPTRSATDVHVVVEIPKGSRNKYELRHDSDEIWLDRHLFTATNYPADYGFIPDTLAEDGDPLDVLVILEEPTFPGCHLWARPIGVFWMSDDAGPDAKILAVPAADPRWAHIADIGDVAQHLLAEIGHFFEIYKALEPAKFTEVRGWQGRREALAAVDAARRRVDAPLPN